MYRVERAIIMAAGLGNRMKPVTLYTPKPLISVNGTRMIDSVIQALHSNGINEIYVVVGYLKEQFKDLTERYDGITLIDNPYYDKCNNIASLFVARDYIKNAIILDADQLIINKSALRPEFEMSGYNGVFVDGHTDEWLMQTEGGRVVSCSRTGGSRGWQLFSVSRWNEEDGALLKKHLELEFLERKNTGVYWDDIPMFLHRDEYNLGVFEMQIGDVVEIDTVNELCDIDSSYKKYIQEN